jgi:hypothetical protein
MATAGPKLFRCPKCRASYLGHDPLPDCPHCGYDYRDKQPFRWDVVVYLLAILALLSFVLMSSYYRGFLGSSESRPADPPADAQGEKLPGTGGSPINSPYHEGARGR